MIGAWDAVIRFGPGYAWPTSVPLGVAATLASIELGAAKITGTGASCDLWLMRVAGTNQVLDFTDAGFASTFCPTMAEIEDVFVMLIGNLTYAGVDCF